MVTDPLRPLLSAIAPRCDSPTPPHLESRRGHPKTELDNSRFPPKHFFTQFSAELRCHTSLQGFQNRTRCRAIVYKRLRTVMKWDSGTRAEEFIMRRLIVVWEPAPTTHVVDKNRFVFCAGVDNIFCQFAKRFAVARQDSTLSDIRVGLHDGKAVEHGILLESCLLIFNRILLGLVRHANILRCGNRGGYREGRLLCLHRLTSTAAVPTDCDYARRLEMVWFEMFDKISRSFSATSRSLVCAYSRKSSTRLSLSNNIFGSIV